jgi:hypothetical protein
LADVIRIATQQRPEVTAAGARAKAAAQRPVIVLSVLVKPGLHHIPATQQLFRIGALSPPDCALTLLAGSVPFVIIEIAKFAKTVARHA